MIEHLSGSSMNTFENNIHEFYTRYVLWEEPEYFPSQVEAMDYWKNYEIALGKKLWDKRDTQKVIEENIWGFIMYGLLDFYNEEEKKVIECKTKSWEWKEKDIHESWQFRYYNWWCNKNWYEFILHQFNKKTWETKVDKINWVDAFFETKFIEKAHQIKRFLGEYDVVLKYEFDLKNDI